MSANRLLADAPDATALLAGYHSGRMDPVSVAEAHLERIEQIEPTLNAFSAIAADVLEQAAESRDRWRDGRPRGALDGVPVIIKDNLVSAGLPAAWGNAELAGRVPEHDELPVAAIRRAGAVILGKGNCPEFAVEGFTGNAIFGVTGNPYNPALTPGGSSGGVVAAVASGMAVAGLATDGGGSIRRPAAYTGLWGLKPGIGSVQRREGLPQVLLDFETVGPITRSARDLALFYENLSGQVRHPRQGEVSVQQPLRILAVARMDNCPCDPEILARFEAAVDGLSGHHVVRDELPIDLADLNTVWSRIAEIGLGHLKHKEPAVVAAAADKYRDMAERGSSANSTELYDILTCVFELREAARGLFGYDIIMTPAAAAMPWPAAEPYPNTIDGQAVGPRGHAVYTGWVNAAGLPALTCPAGMADGLPVGVQFIADHGREWTLLSLATTLG